MTGKEVLFKTLRHEETERPAWVPMAGVHAGFLKGYTADEVYQDADKLVESLLEVEKMYAPDGLILLFDLQLEAEILGCTIKWEKNGPPSVRSHPLESTFEIPDIKITRDSGRIPLVLDVTRRIKKAVGDRTALYGLFCGPYTLASHLRGTNFFRDARQHPEYVKELMAYTTELGLQMADFYLEEGVDVIVPVDPVVSQISPTHFKNFVFEPYAKIFGHIRNKGAFSSFFVCGNATHILELMCQTKPDSLAAVSYTHLHHYDEMLDRLWQAAIDLVAEVGVLCTDTRRIIEFSRKEILDAAANTADRYTVGVGKDSFTAVHRGFEDYDHVKNPVSVLGRILGPVSQDIYHQIAMSYAQVPQIDMCHFQGNLTEIYGMPITPDSPWEMFSELWSVAQVKDCLLYTSRCV